MNFPKFLRLILMAKNIQINSTTTVKKYLLPEDLKVSSLFAEMYKFSYEFVSPSDGEYGRQLSNGNWTGMAGMVLRSEGDIPVSLLTITVERMEFFDFSFPLIVTPVTFITTKPEYSSDITAFLNPFTKDLWISLVSLLIIMPAILLTFFRERFTYDKLLLATFRSLLSQPFGITPQNVKEYLLIFFYIIGIVFFIHSYTCVLLSFITFPTFSGVRTIRELATSVVAGKHKCVTYPGAFLAAALVKSEDPSYRIIGRDMQQNEGTFDVYDVLRSSKKNSKRAFVGIMESFNPFKEMYFVSQDQFFPNILAFTMRKDFCCREQVTSFVLFMNAYGHYQKILRHQAFRDSLKYVFKNVDGNADGSVRQFSLEDLAGAFVVLCIGYALSFAVLVFEMVFHTQRIHPKSSKFIN